MMPRKRYYLLSASCLLDINELKMITMSQMDRNGIIYIPVFLETVVHDTLSNFSTVRMSTGLNFKGIALSWTENLRQLNIECLNIKKRKRNSIIVRTDVVKDSTVLSCFGDYCQEIALNIDGYNKVEIKKLRNGTYKFNKLRGLYNFDVTAYINKVLLNMDFLELREQINFAYGMLSTKQTVYYKDKQLKDKYYVFMFGFVALLLEDDLSMAGVVFLRGQSVGKVYIEQVLYGVDARLVKLIFLDSI